MNPKFFLEMAEALLKGNVPDRKDYRAFLAVSDEDTLSLLPGAEMLRKAGFGNGVHLCTILNGKSGRCSEDCGFCAQSAFSRTDAPVYSLLSREKMVEAGRRAESTVVNRFSIVTSGRALPPKEVKQVAEALGDLDPSRVRTCASLGCIEREELGVLRAAGVTRYHHNLETAEGFFEKICTTHPYEERVRTIRDAKSVGLSVCAGGIFGLGETDEQVLELALTLKDLDVESVPLNFLSPIPGTSLEKAQYLTPFRCLRIIGLFRYALPDKDILICGGRELNLDLLHPLVFAFGASGIMTADYLTTRGRTLEDDLTMIRKLGMAPRPKVQDAELEKKSE